MHLDIWRSRHTCQQHEIERENTVWTYCRYRGGLQMNIEKIQIEKTKLTNEY